MAYYTLLDAKYDGNIVRLFYLSDEGRIEEWEGEIEYHSIRINLTKFHLVPYSL
jgi:hypothetical protein